MPLGTLEVLLIGAKGLDNTDFLANMDPYAILTYRSQEKKSNVASGNGETPEWNEAFLFSISEGVSELKIKLMDKDTFSSDDFVGEATITLDPVFDEGNLPPTSYNVVKDEEYRGEVRVALTFNPQTSYEERSFGQENLGGWKQSDADY